MGRKRKVAPKSSVSAEPPLKQHQPKPENAAQEYEEEVEEEVEEEEVEEEVEEEEEEEEDEEDEEEEEEDQKDQYQHQQQQQDEDDDPISKLLEPLSKDQLLILLCEAAAKHQDVAERIRRAADEDPVHRKIFVHGLGWDTTAGTLISSFRQYGEIEDCKAVTDKVSGKSKGYGFILFKTRRGARNALKEPQKKIGNRMTACQLASIGPVSNPPQTAPPAVAAPSSSVSEYTQKKIYVSNVGADLDPQKLLAFFSRFGEIEEGPLGLDKATGKPKGFCLFVYRSPESARRALEEPHKDFEGHILHCQKAIDGPKAGKLQQHGNVNAQAQRAQFQRNGSVGTNAAAGYGGGAALQPGHLMAPAGPGIGFNQSAAAAQAALNPAMAQALTALLASQGTLGLTNLLGSIGTSAAVNPGVPSAGAAVQGGYSAQPNISPGVVGGYGNQVGLQLAYPNQNQNQQIGQGGSGRGQYGGGSAPYMGH
uniref:RRM domain-containing protein n=1 Tax=Glycine max TaxID=3847 RepID=K7MY09_SOYBN|eukprot:XP_003554083.1 UBP1-associated protein 2A [Glycine max]